MNIYSKIMKEFIMNKDEKLEGLLENKEKILKNKEDFQNWSYAMNMTSAIFNLSARKLYKILNKYGKKYFYKDYFMYPEFSEEKFCENALNFMMCPNQLTASISACQVVAVELYGILMNQEVDFSSNETIKKGIEELNLVKLEIEHAFNIFQERISNNNISETKYNTILAESLIENIFIDDDNYQTIIENMKEYINFKKIKTKVI